MKNLRRSTDFHVFSANLWLVKPYSSKVSRPFSVIFSFFPLCFFHFLKKYTTTGFLVKELHLGSVYSASYSYKSSSVEGGTFEAL